MNLWQAELIQPETRVVLEGETIPALFWNAVQARGEEIWLRQKELGIWQSQSWAEVGQIVREMAAGLLHLGLARGEVASILSNTNIEWVLADLAVLSCGGVANGIYPTDAAAQVHYLSEDSRSTILFVEDDEQLDKALEVRERLPLLRKSDGATTRPVCVIAARQSGSTQALRALGRELGVAEWHVHFCGEADAVVSDLSGSLLH